jgi:hypothetical protein
MKITTAKFFEMFKDEIATFEYYEQGKIKFKCKKDGYVVMVSELPDDPHSMTISKNDTMKMTMGSDPMKSFEKLNEVFGVTDITVRSKNEIIYEVHE